MYAIIWRVLHVVVVVVLLLLLFACLFSNAHYSGVCMIPKQYHSWHFASVLVSFVSVVFFNLWSVACCCYLIHLPVFFKKNRAYLSAINHGVEQPTPSEIDALLLDIELNKMVGFLFVFACLSHLTFFFVKGVFLFRHFVCFSKLWLFQVACFWSYLFQAVQKWRDDKTHSLRFFEPYLAVACRARTDEVLPP